MPNNSFESYIEQIPAGTASTLQDLEKVVNGILATVPKLDRDALRCEMGEMVVEMSKNPTTFDINEGLAKSQAYRDRLSEILFMAQNEYKIRKRCMEMLFDAVNLISKASSADKRRGEAVMRYPMMIIQTEAADIFVKEVEQMCANMRSTSESISRQVSVMQIQLQLGERRQGSSKAIEFNSEAESIEATGKKNFQYQGNKNWSDDFNV